jgi:hypothetical protein
MHVLPLDPEAGSKILLRNVGLYRDYTVLQCRKQHSSHVYAYMFFKYGLFKEADSSSEYASLSGGMISD